MENPVYTREYLRRINFYADADYIMGAFIWSSTVEGWGFWAGEYEKPSKVGLRIWRTMRESARYYEEERKNQ